LFLATAPLGASTLTNSEGITNPDANTTTFAALPNLSASDLLSLTPEQYRAQTGEKLSFKDRISLRLVKKSIRKHLKHGEDFQVADVVDDNKFHFMIGPFLLGLFLGLIGFLICLAFKDRKSALISGGIGWGIAIVLVLILLAGKS
jgi:hypothetical protein